MEINVSLTKLEKAVCLQLYIISAYEVKKNDKRKKIIKCNYTSYFEVIQPSTDQCIQCKYHIVNKCLTLRTFTVNLIPAIKIVGKVS